MMCFIFSAYSVQLKAGAVFGIGPQSLLSDKVHNKWQEQDGTENDHVV